MTSRPKSPKPAPPPSSSGRKRRRLTWQGLILALAADPSLVIRPGVRIRPTNATKQRGYRHRFDEGEIRPSFPIGSRIVEFIIVMATRYGKMTRRDAEAKSCDRRWVVAELIDYLDKQADEYGIEKRVHRRRKIKRSQ